MLLPDTVVRTNRRSLSLVVNKRGEFIVKAPRSMSMTQVMEFVKQKEKWVQSKKTRAESILKINSGIVGGTHILFCGKTYKVEPLHGIKKIEMSDDSFYYPDKYDDVTLKYAIKKWLTTVAKKVLPNRVEYFAKLMQIDYNLVGINNAKTMWGCCDSEFNIKLNFRLMMLPHRIIDFIIIHELCHVLEFNHSKNFYKILSSVMPDYKDCQKALKDYDYLLTLYR